MRSSDQQIPLASRLGIWIGSWLVWIIPAGKDALTEEPGWVWNTHEVVAGILFALGMSDTFTVPLLMYYYNVGTSPLRILAGLGVYLAFGLLYLTHMRHQH